MRPTGLPTRCSIARSGPPRRRCSGSRNPTDTGCSSSRPTARFPPNTCCCAITAPSSTIPAEYVLLRHYRAEPVDAELERKIAVYLRRTQGRHGGWPLFQDGDFDMSASVKAYFALKMIGDDTDASHMKRARDAILARGGAASANVFTCSLLALYGVLSLRPLPVEPGGIQP